MTNENQPKGAGSGEPAEAEDEISIMHPCPGCPGCRPAPAEASEAEKAYPYSTIQAAEQAGEKRIVIGETVPQAPATGRECWVLWSPEGIAWEVRNIGEADQYGRTAGYEWVRMVEPPPSSPAREDVEPSGTASLRGAARLPDSLRGDGPCSDCGTIDNIAWFTDNVIWNMVCRRPEDALEPILCIPCFVKRTDAAGYWPVAWRLLPEWHHETKEGARARKGGTLPGGAPEARSALPSSAGPSLSPSSPPSPASQGAETDPVFEYALNLTKQMARNYYPENHGWAPLDTTVGLLTQIDNMVAGLGMENGALRAKVETLEAKLANAEAKNGLALERIDGLKSGLLGLKERGVLDHDLIHALLLNLPIPAGAVERAPEAPALANVLKKACAVVYDWREESRDEAKFAKLLEALEDACVAALPDGTPVEAPGDAKRVEEAGHRPLQALEVVEEGDESWSFRDEWNGGKWIPVTGAIGSKYTPWNGETGIHLPIRRPRKAPPAESSPPLPDGEGSSPKSSPEAPPAGPAVDLAGAWLAGWAAYAEAFDHTPDEPAAADHSRTWRLRRFLEGRSSPGGSAHG